MTPFPAAIFFDLDGTLVDSAPDIRACLFEALRECKVDLTGRVERFRIGPPLSAMIRIIAPELSEDCLASVVAAFRRQYDQSAYPLTVPFEGVESLLAALKQNGFPLYVATNKPIFATKRIIEKVGWRYFNAILTPDSMGGTRLTKAQLLQKMSAERGYNPGKCLMVGDLPEDVDSARLAGFRSVVVTWGYGTTSERDHCGADWFVSKPEDILSISKDISDV